MVEMKKTVQNTWDLGPGSGKQWVCWEIELIFIGQVLEGNDIHFWVFFITLYKYKFLSRLIFFLLKEPSLIFLESKGIGNEFPHYLFVWERLYFLFIKKKKIFHWILSYGLRDLSFDMLNVSPLHLLVCMVSEEKSSIILIYSSANVFF